MGVRKFFGVLILTLTLIFVTFNKNVQAVPANESKRMFNQPGGITFMGSLAGDENFNYVISEDGKILKQNSEGYWCYANLIYGRILPSVNKYKIDEEPTEALTKESMGIKQKVEKSILAPPKRSSLSKISSQPSYDQKVLLILVEFTDMKLTYGTDAWYKSLFDPNSKSLNKFYKENSFGKMNFGPVQESQGTVNDGVVVASLNYQHPNYGGSLDGGIQTDIKNAIEASDNYINFASYDKNGDRKLDTDEIHIIIAFAGQEAASGGYNNEPSIWAHKWNLALNFSCDNINFYGQDYTALGEKNGATKATIGTLCHELGHDLGLVDLYDTDDTSSGVGQHSLMDSGSWGSLSGEEAGQTPSHLDAWSKAYLGFVQPTIVDYDTEVMLNSIITEKYNVVKVITKNPKEYFLLENRQHFGFDESLSTDGINAGVAIWHINEAVIESKFYSNSINNNEYDKGIDLEEANMKDLGFEQLNLSPEEYFNSGYSYGLKHYYTKGQYNIFSRDTLPNSNVNYAYDYDYNSGITIEVLSDSNSSMRVSIKGEKFIDFDNDGYINITDLGSVAKLYNVTSANQSYVRRYDVNGDNIIDIFDLVKVSSRLE